MTINKPVRVRFAPSPTGLTHLGSGRTALYNFLIARKSKGQFILRIEDTDQKRYYKGAEEELMTNLRWLGLDWDEGPDIGGKYQPYRQTERKLIYQKYAQKLIDRGFAYYCFCTQAEKDGIEKDKDRKHHRDFCPDRELPINIADSRRETNGNYVIRFKMPTDGKITVNDVLRGPITVENESLDDYILLKSDGLPVYHLAVVVDDHLMEITHVIRTSEWLPTFPLHGHLYEAFGWEQPVWIHPSIFLNPDGKGKMSKRESFTQSKGGKSIFIGDLKELGYLPEAVINWVVLMGWSFDDKTEFFTLEDLIEKFSIGKLNPAPATINYSKLDHFNGLHIRKLAVEELAMRIKPFLEKAGYVVADDYKLHKVAEVLQNRLVTLDEAPQKAGFFFKDHIEINAEDLIGKNLTIDQTLEIAKDIQELINSFPDFSEETMDVPLRNLAKEKGVKAGHVFSFLRNSVTGERVTPPIFETMQILGKEIVQERVETAIQTLSNLQ